jgi:ferredoxin
LSRRGKAAPAPAAPPLELPGDDDEDLEQEEDDVEPGVCRYCGCTEAEACPEGCGWADEDETICTACQDLALELGFSALDTLVELEGPIKR